jgi:hypothetical protein
VLYRPRPFDLVDKEMRSAGWLHEQVAAVDASLVIVDVLRAAARFRENVSEDFALVRDALAPILAADRTVVLLHHFGKLTDTQKERSPGGRTAGTGAMYGALDVGFLITRSENGARRLRVDIEARDFAAPDALGVVIEGNGSGEHGGFTYADTAALVIDETAAEERDLAREMEELFADGVCRTGTELSSRAKGIGANRDEVLATLAGSPARFVQVDGPRVGRHVNAQPWGTRQMLAQRGARVEVVRHRLHEEDAPRLPPARRRPHAARGDGRRPARPRRCRSCPRWSASGARIARGRRASTCGSCTGTRSCSPRPGKPQSRRNALRALHKAGDNAGLNPAGVEQVGLHDLRHSFVALALDARMSLAEVALHARHANARVTGQLYAGLSDKARTQLASKLTDAGVGT